MERTGSSSITAGYQPLVKMQEKAAQLKQELEALTKAEKHAQFKRTLSVVVRTEGLSAAGTGSRRFPRTPGQNVGTQPDRPSSALQVSNMRSRRTSIASTEHSVGGNDDAASMRTSMTGMRRFGAHSPSRGPQRELLEQYQGAISRQNQLEEVVADLETEVRSLQADRERRQGSYMRREEELQASIRKLEDQLRVAKGERPANPAFGKASENIKELHTMVVGKIEELLDAQASTLRAEEHTTLRRFAGRLDELGAQVAAERGTPSKAEGEWMERTIALRQELATTQDIAQVLDRKHQVLTEESGRLRAQLKLQEDDREYLIRQTVTLKKENAALKNQTAALLADVSSLVEEREELLASCGTMLAGSRGAGDGDGAAGAAASSGLPAGVDRDAVQIKIARYDDVIDSLKRLLEAERRRTKQARAAHTAELAQRTQLQAILRQCVEDVRGRRRMLEADGSREQQSAERASLRSRPLSARPPHGASVSVSRPSSAAPHLLLRSPSGAGSFGAPAVQQRPQSASPSAAAAAGAGWGGPGQQQQTQGEAGGGAGTAAASWAAAQQQQQQLSPRSREALVETLLGHEELLKLLFDRAFPGVAPHPPSDPLLDRMAAWQETRDAQVAANAKVLAAARAGAVPPSAAVKESTPGGLLGKEAAARPWVLNVDAMLAQFLQGGAAAGAASGGGSGVGGAAAAVQSRSGRGA